MEDAGIGKETIETVSEAKLLGTTITNNLNAILRLNFSRISCQFNVCIEITVFGTL